MTKYGLGRSGSDKAANRIKIMEVRLWTVAIVRVERYAVEDIWIYERSLDIVSFYNNITAFSFLLSEPPYANGGIFVQ